MKTLTVVVFILLIVTSLIQCSETVKPTLRGVENFNAPPGVGEYSFTVENKQSINSKTIKIQMTLNVTILTMETTIEYSKYEYIDETSNLMEFRYYKSCASSGLIRPSYTLTDTHVSIVIGDSMDSTILYNFKLDKKEITMEEKIDLMFNTMNKEIAELKERLWFVDPSSNKLATNHNLVVGDTNLEKFIKGETSMYSGIYSKMDYVGYMYVNGGGSIECPQSSSYCSGARPLTISFPTRTIISKLELEFKNGGTCPYTDTINYTIKVLYTRYAPNLYTSGYSAYTRFDTLSGTLSSTRLSDGFTKFDLTVKQPVFGDLVAIFISSNGHRSPSGTNFDGNCNFEMRKLKIY